MQSRNVWLNRSDESVLVIVDVQVRLASAMPAEARDAVVRNCGNLLQAASLLSIPAIVTEQYPKGLGPTEPGIVDRDAARHVARIEKTCFSCAGAEAFRDALKNTARRQVVLAGMETHVCVLQTALDLLAEDFEVFVVEDAVSSRRPAHATNALYRLRQAGVVITNTESVLFEWLRDARHEHFRAISALVK
jgi:nicotinamidase-related amidase